jgi:hypothetical protein
MPVLGGSVVQNEVSFCGGVLRCDRLPGARSGGTARAVRAEMRWGRTSDVKCAAGSAWPMLASTIVAPRVAAAAFSLSRAAAETEPPATTASRVSCSAMVRKASVSLNTPTTEKPCALRTSVAPRIFSGDLPRTTTVDSAGITAKATASRAREVNRKRLPPHRLKVPLGGDTAQQCGWVRLVAGRGRRSVRHSGCAVGPTVLRRPVGDRAPRPLRGVLTPVHGVVTVACTQTAGGSRSRVAEVIPAYPALSSNQARSIPAVREVSALAPGLRGWVTRADQGWLSSRGGVYR